MYRLVAAVIFQLLFLFAYPQFATKGTGALRNEIWWVNWAGFPIQDGSTKTFTTPDGLTVTVKMSNVLDSDLFSHQMNTWPGAILHLLYDFDDPAIHPALFSENSLRSPSSTLQITATRNGAPAAFTLIAADAEASTVDEVVTLLSAGTWQFPPCVRFLAE